jgi:hypothetical protein
MANGKNAGRLYPTPETTALLDQMKALDSDEITLRVDHTQGRKPVGPRPGPSTISEEGFEALVEQFKFFVAGRILARLDEGESVELIEADVTLKLSDGGTSDEPHEPEGR